MFFWILSAQRAIKKVRIVYTYGEDTINLHLCPYEVAWKKAEKNILNTVVGLQFLLVNWQKNCYIFINRLDVSVTKKIDFFLGNSVL